MKRFIQLVVAAVLLGSLTIQADPFRTWSWDDPVAYDNNGPIPAGDLTARTLHCGNNPGDPSIPDGSAAFGHVGACADRYETSTVFVMQTSPSKEDMAFVVAGQPGTYYCASSVGSVEKGLRSGCSTEVNFIVAALELKVAPLPPANLQVRNL